MTAVAIARDVRFDSRPAVPAIPLAEWLGPALAIPLVEIAVDVTVGHPLRLKSPTCAVLRGLMGARVRDLRCLTAASDHCACAPSALCDYAQMMETAGSAPFWFHGVPASWSVDAGACFTARLYLAPPLHAVAPYLDVALRDGLRALDATATLSPSRWRKARLGELLPPPPSVGPLHLAADTPLCLRGDDAICRALCPAAPWLALLVRAGVRRLDALVRTFAPAPTGRLPRAALPDLTDVHVVADTFAPCSSSRFSRRQGQRMPLHGLTGAAVAHGDQLHLLVPLLRALAVTSVGKATSLGFGGLRLGPVGSPARGSDATNPQVPTRAHR